MASKPEDRAAAGAAAIVAALLLPPLGVYLRYGLRPIFWAAVALTCLGYVPGMVLALIAVLRPRPSGHLAAA